MVSGENGEHNQMNGNIIKQTQSCPLCMPGGSPRNFLIFVNNIELAAGHKESVINTISYSVLYNEKLE